MASVVMMRRVRRALPTALVPAIHHHVAMDTVRLVKTARLAHRIADPSPMAFAAAETPGAAANADVIVAATHASTAMLQRKQSAAEMASAKALSLQLPVQRIARPATPNATCATAAQDADVSKTTSAAAKIASANVALSLSAN